MDPTIKKAIQQAEEVLLLSKEERKELVNCLPSDEEDSVEDGDQTVQSDDESPSKVTQGHKRKSSGHSANKNSDDDDDDDEVTGRKVHFSFKGQNSLTINKIFTIKTFSLGRCRLCSDPVNTDLNTSYHTGVCY